MTRVTLTKQGKQFEIDTMSKAADPNDPCYIALTTEANLLGARRETVEWNAILGGIATKLAALGPTGSSKRRRAWTATLALADRLLPWAVARGLFVIVD